MRPYALAALLAGTAALPAQAAGPCAAHAEVATAGAVVLGSGSFACAVPNGGMTVTVCVEAFGLSRGSVWRVLDCATGTAPGSATSVDAGVGVCYLDGPALVRATATGTNAAGDSATATSVPTWAPGFGSCGP